MSKLDSVVIKTTFHWQSLKEPEEQLFSSLLLSGAHSTKEVTAECCGKQSLIYKCQKLTSNWKRQGGRIIELTKTSCDDFKHDGTQGFKLCHYNLVPSLGCALFNDSSLLKQVLPLWLQTPDLDIVVSTWIMCLPLNQSLWLQI